jgi:hypothetical protein
MSKDGRTRCGWGDWTDPHYLAYPDEEGVVNYMVCDLA